jgi:site-specific DNA-cytosine methylase
MNNEIKDKKLIIKNVLQNKVDKRYFLTEKQKSKLDLNFKWKSNLLITHKAGKHQQDIIYDFNGKMGCLSASTHGAGRHLTKTHIGNGEIRRLTEVEIERLQTLPDNYTEGVSSSKRYELIGNGWTVEVIKHIFSFLPKEFLFKEDLTVLSPFDGISCGQQALKELRCSQKSSNKKT